MAQQPDYSFKILLVGESGVGKSALIVRYTDQLFTETYTCTIGVDFKLHTMMIDDKRVRLHIWDTAGQERYRSITSSYYRNSDGILLVFDLTAPDSLTHVERWVSHLEEQLSPRTKIFIVGNKEDEMQEGAATRSVANQIREFAASKGLGYKEVSAKTGTHVQELFAEITTTIKQYQDASGIKSQPGSVVRASSVPQLGPRRRSGNLNVNNAPPPPPEKKEEGCCS